MPIITVQMLEGRTPAQKRNLIEALGQAAVKMIDVPEEAVRVILTEVAPEHWGVGSRSMADLRNAPKRERL